MLHKKTLLFFCLLVGAGSVNMVVQNVTQPIGTLVRTWDTTGALPFAPVNPPAAPFGTAPYNGGNVYPIPTTPIGEVNYICAQWDDEEVPVTAPFDTNYKATEIILTQPQHFVRLLVTPTSSPNGAWIMRSEYVRGKTPAQLKDIFALAGPPINIVNVEMPASPDPSTGKYYVLWTGIAGPINTSPYLWGDGGSVQSRLVVDAPTTVHRSVASTYFPNYKYTSSSTRNHVQPIGAIALAYAPLAGGGSAGNVAAYLDTFIPQAYSDLENVYHALDYLNYVYYGSDPLQDALVQISPKQYSGLSFINYRNALLFSNTLLERKKCNNNSKFNFGIQGISEFDNKGRSFRIQSGGVLACLDVQTHEHFCWGVGAAGIWNDLSWKTKSGKVHGQNAKLGFYAAYCHPRFFIDGTLCGGGNWNKTYRGIKFNGVNRQAYSNSAGEDIELSVQGGTTFSHMVTPILRASYLFNRQNHFKEGGAQSLNLRVNGFDMHMLRTYVGVEVAPVADHAQSINILPYTSLAWVNDILLNDFRIRAKIDGPENNFSVSGIRQEGSYCDLGLGCDVWFEKWGALYAHYDAQARGHFTAHAVKLGVNARF